ncbi:hypothetical protein Pan189_06820 [Stratiformator vulcanicus]|uniref:Uncharacterized protein n=1 Tax=Stratiformator vulcanicus TaxID=2527980 RepID=A0A517QXD3_9PLAN|nr:hypothetical protein Pan189_06820 [Stratiformator vulcanicus]
MHFTCGLNPGGDTPPAPELPYLRVRSEGPLISEEHFRVR